METHECLKRLKKIQYEIQPEDCDGLSESLLQESDIEPLCLEIAEAAIEHELHAKAVAERISELTERKGRLLRTSETLRNLVLQAMDIRGKQTIKSPIVTLSIAKRAGDLVITDESLLPSRFFKPQPLVLDKKALKDAVVSDGEIIEGTAIGNGSISLTIRRK
jgi:Siphovirus Gp157